MHRRRYADALADAAVKADQAHCRDALARCRIPAGSACDTLPANGTARLTNAVVRLSVPSPEELLERARAMVPEIRELAQKTEENRGLFPHIVEKIRTAELLRTCRPREFGGFEYDGEVALKIALTISAA